MANLDLVDLQDPEETMAKMETKELLDLQDLLANKEKEVVLDLRETKDSKVFQDQLVTQERLEDLVNLVSMENKELREKVVPEEIEEALV